MDFEYLKKKSIAHVQHFNKAYTQQFEQWSERMESRVKAHNW